MTAGHTIRANDPYVLTYQFHEAFNQPIHTQVRMPTVSDRLLRGKLLLEEVQETIEKGLGLRIYLDRRGELCVEHKEGFVYDPVETADGLADVMVIANGTALCFGIPMREVNYEVYSSNMSKLEQDTGKPIINECIKRFCTGECHEQDHLRDPSQPVGKILKPSYYRPANIRQVLIDYGGWQP